MTGILAHRAYVVKHKNQFGLFLLPAGLCGGAGDLDPFALAQALGPSFAALQTAEPSQRHGGGVTTVISFGIRWRGTRCHVHD